MADYNRSSGDNTNDEATRSAMQRGTPPAPRQPLDGQLGRLRLNDRKATVEPPRPFWLTTRDKERLAQGYERRHGARLPQEQVLVEEYAYRRSRNPECDSFPDSYLDILEFAEQYSAETKKIIKDLGRECPKVDFWRWTKEAGQLDDSLRKHNRNGNLLGVESVIRGMESLRAEIYVARKFSYRLIAVRLPVEYEDIKSDFDVVLGTGPPTTTMQKLDPNCSHSPANIKQIIEVKHTEPYGEGSSTCADLLEQLNRIKKLRNENCPDAELSCWFTKGVGRTVAQRLIARNIKVFGEQFNL